MLGGSCNPCCGGGWYCCPPAECALDVASSIVVTITPAASECVRKIRQRSSVCTSFAAYDQTTLAVPTGSLAGTHSLSKVSPVRWEKTLAVDQVGCLQPTLAVELLSFSGTSGSWMLRINYPAYYWWLRTTSSGTAFKSLLDMSCQNTPPWSGPYCNAFLQDREEYHASLIPASMYRGFQCAATGAESFTTTLLFAFPPIAVDLEGPAQDPANTDTTTGSLSFGIVVAIS